MSNDEEFLLKWNNHQTNLIGVFKDWLQDESFVDVTLVCGGEAVAGHKVVLAACSPLLNRILHDNPCRHPVVILNDVCSTDMKALLKFIYQGEVSVSQSELASFLKTADNLQIKGLAEDREEDKKRKDDVGVCGVRKKRKTDPRSGTTNQPQLQKEKEESPSSSPNSQSQNACILNSSINQNELSSSATFSNSLNHQVENSKMTNSHLQSDSSNSSVTLSKESMLIVKTEPLDYAGEMVWQESNSNILLKPEVGVNNINKSSASNSSSSSSSSNNSINGNTSCNNAQNPEMQSAATLPFVVIHPSLENIDSTSTADLLQKNLELVLSGEEKRSEDELKNVSFGSEDLNQPTLNAVYEETVEEETLTLGSQGKFRGGRKRCCFCGKTFCDNYTLRRHMVTHLSRQRQFECSLCSAAYSRKDHLMAHMRRKHPIDAFDIEVANRSS